MATSRLPPSSRVSTTSRPPSSTRPPRTLPTPDDFKKFIKSRVSQLVSSDLVDKFVSDDSMRVWNRAFTDQTVSPDNYELDETLGDSALNLAFYHVIRKSLPNVHQPKMYATLKAFYVSEGPFSKFASEAGFLDYLRIPEALRRDNTIMRKKAEDLWESYHGALFELGNKIGQEEYGIEIGYNCVKNSMVLILNDLVIDKERAYGAFKNQLREISQGISLRVENASIYLADEKKVGFYLYVQKNSLREILQGTGKSPEEIEEILEDKESRRILSTIGATKGINPNTSLLIGSAVAQNNSEAEDEASRNAVHTLRDKFGISELDIEKIKAKKLGEKFSEHIEEIRKHYQTFRISQQKYGTNTLYSLLVALPNGKMKSLAFIKVLTTTPFEDVQRDLYKRAVENLSKK